MARFTACGHCGELLMENGRNWVHADGFFTCLANPGTMADPIDADAIFAAGVAAAQEDIRAALDL